MILNIDMAHPLAGSFWRDRRPLVLACGCFDILTIGHIRHLKEAKRLGACLCVLVTADRHVNKGPRRPVFGEDLRAEVVDSLACVDFTVINPHPTAVEAIRSFSPQVYVKGREYRFRSDVDLLAEVNVLRTIDGRLEYTDTEELHTTDVLEQLMSMKVPASSMPPCKGWIGRRGDLPCELCGWPAQAHPSSTDLADKGVRTWK